MTADVVRCLCTPAARRNPTGVCCRAVKAGNREMVEAILKVLEDGSGALHAALSSPTAAAMLPLLLPKCGNHVDNLDEEGRTPLLR